MSTWAIVLMILAMKIPIFGLIWLVWWAGRAPATDEPAEAVRIGLNPHPEPPLPLRPRRRGPHGVAAGHAPRSAGAVGTPGGPARTRC